MTLAANAFTRADVAALGEALGANDTLVGLHFEVRNGVAHIKI